MPGRRRAGRRVENVEWTLVENPGVLPSPLLQIITNYSMTPATVLPVPNTFNS